MRTVVMKFGGSSLANIELIRRIAERIAARCRPDEHLVVVVSAMGKTTDNLLKMAREVSDHPAPRELDMLLTAGERISMSLLSLALQEHGIESISFTGSQSGIITDTAHGHARILRVNAFRITEALATGKVVIVAGFQGVSTKKEVTTLGRGGSDTTAVALAYWLQADACEICTDVDGVYSADPRIVPNAHKIEGIDYPLMLTLAYFGSKVLHPRAVEYAYDFQRPVEVKSSFTLQPGTIVEQAQQLEQYKVTAIAHCRNLREYRLEASPQRIGSLLIELDAKLPGIFYYALESGSTIFLLMESRFEPLLSNLDGATLHCGQSDLAAVTLAGHRLWSDFVALAEIRALLLDHTIETLRVIPTPLSLGFVISDADLAVAVNALHEKYCLQSVSSETAKR
jgi:aspartate kinase